MHGGSIPPSSTWKSHPSGWLLRVSWSVGLTTAECEQIIAEASPRVAPTKVALTACNAWRVPRRSATATILGAHGVDASDSQVVRYGPGGEYVWHTDGPTRARTLMIQLSAPRDYEGGRLEVQEEGSVRVGGNERGSITEFDSTLQHRVTRLESGERMALIVWFSS